MTPGEITMATALIGLIKVMGSWPLSIILPMIAGSIFLGPWGMMLLISRAQERRAEAQAQEQARRDATHDLRTVELMDEIKEVFSAAIRDQEKRFQAVSQMYENNVLLVKGYEHVAADLINIIHLNIQTNTKLVEKINNNHYCPVIRQKSGSESNG